MTDRELLEAAARAAGITNLQWESDGTIQNRMNRPTIPYECHGMTTAIDWNPLAGDGDALRLAVKLRLTIQHNHSSVVCYDNPDFADKRQTTVEAWESGQDLYAATRRAIVRAAAALGERDE